MPQEREELLPSGPKPEARPKPEVGVEPAQEQGAELPAEVIREEAPFEKEAPPSPTPVWPAPSTLLPVKDKETVAIENILADDLEETFGKMPPELQAKFKQKGEEVAGKIRTMMRQARVKAKGILQLIRDWLRMIPGVNRFFLEQESKIKTDKILAYAEKEKSEDG
ncbi:hypothetical protein HY628_01545 [Candidatus Uhrbacteria bacterium]|nr:hypothetical protein [Candidatus Uhrbacteria bacterium]